MSRSFGGYRDIREMRTSAPGGRAVIAGYLKVSGEVQAGGVVVFGEQVVVQHKVLALTCG
jgi:hypothetical protein